MYQNIVGGRRVWVVRMTVLEGVDPRVTTGIDSGRVGRSIVGRGVVIGESLKSVTDVLRHNTCGRGARGVGSNTSSNESDEAPDTVSMRPRRCRRMFGRSLGGLSARFA